MIGTVSSWPKFIWKFTEDELTVAHSIIDTHDGEFPVKNVHLGDHAVHFQKGLKSQSWKWSPV